MQINCEHPVKATRITIRSLLKAKKPGVIMCISSVAGQTLRLDLPIYCASKAFVNHFVWSMADLHQQENIRVMAVAPGHVYSPIVIILVSNGLLQFGCDTSLVSSQPRKDASNRCFVQLDSAS